MRKGGECWLKRSDALPFILRERPRAAPSRPPNFQTGVAYFRIRSRRSATETCPAKVGRLGGTSAPGAHTIFRLSLRECQPERE